jgi:hypothetical protein
MNTPGFTAEESLHKANERYRMVRTFTIADAMTDDYKIVPQEMAVAYEPSTDLCSALLRCCAEGNPWCCRRVPRYCFVEG